ncbi:UNVERIFIED_CONTAM: hypothetical protein PYX00_003616 [Menopon gallinae]|uniref:small monomeric GTPase n=1 Tax=Menopon gallinae TaxID=328185 RepID=A0AAW2I1U8_9NEOP
MTAKKPLLKVLILGDGGVGKSCLMNRFVNNHFDETSFHTIGVEFLKKELTINGESYVLQIWDTAGQERFKGLRTPFYRGSDLCLLVYSIDDRMSFKNLSVWKNEFIYYADLKDPSSFPFVVLGNKTDKPEESRKVTMEDVTAWCKENGDIPNIETSAKDAINVEEAFTMAVKAWASLEEKQEKIYSTDTVNLNSHNSVGASRSGCCSTK